MPEGLRTRGKPLVSPAEGRDLHSFIRGFPATEKSSVQPGVAPASQALLATLRPTHLGLLSEPCPFHVRVVGCQHVVGCGSHLGVIAAEGHDSQAQSI